jgi:putative peptide zinc metalloprotease protein
VSGGREQEAWVDDQGEAVSGFDTTGWVMHTSVSTLGAPPDATERAPAATAWDVTDVTDLDEASAFPAEALVREAVPPPARGWRRALWRATAGRVRPSPSQAESRAQELVATLQRPVVGSRTIAVVSTKGGVGKTTSTLLLGHALASYRGDRVVALDANPDAGSLGYRVRRETSATALDLLEHAHDVERYTDVRAFTSMAGSRLEVIASPDDPHRSRALARDEYQTLLALLDRHYTLVLADCGTGILDSATRGVVEAADQLVIVTAPAVDAARAVAFLLGVLSSHGKAHLVAEAVVVINAVAPPSEDVDVDALEAHFAERVRTVVRIPWDPHLATGAVADVSCLRPATRDAAIFLGAAVAAGFDANAVGA